MTIGSRVKNVTGRMILVFKRVKKGSCSSCDARKRGSPLARRSDVAFHCKIIGEKVSGRKNRAMRKIRPERMSVNQSTQRHDIFDDCTSQPPATGASTGPVYF